MSVNWNIKQRDFCSGWQQHQRREFIEFNIFNHYFCHCGVLFLMPLKLSRMTTTVLNHWLSTDVFSVFLQMFEHSVAGYCWPQMKAFSTDKLLDRYLSWPVHVPISHRVHGGVLMATSQGRPHGFRWRHRQTMSFIVRYSFCINTVETIHYSQSSLIISFTPSHMPGPVLLSAIM